MIEELRPFQVRRSVFGVVSPVRVQPGQRGKGRRMVGRTRRDSLGHLSATGAQKPRTQRKTALALAPTSAEPRVALDGLDVAMAQLERVLQFTERDVFAAANEGLHAGLASLTPQEGPAPGLDRGRLPPCAGAIAARGGAICYVASPSRDNLVRFELEVRDENAHRQLRFAACSVW